jgi:hypothetical protein
LKSLQSNRGFFSNALLGQRREGNFAGALRESWGVWGADCFAADGSAVVVVLIDTPPNAIQFTPPSLLGKCETNDSTKPEISA